MYFAGLALGAHVGGRLPARRPLELWALLEASVAITVVAYLAFRPWLPGTAAWVARSTPAALLPLARAALVAAVLLVPTTLLGCTLPAVAGAVPDVRGAARL